MMWSSRKISSFSFFRAVGIRSTRWSPALRTTISPMPLQLSHVPSTPRLFSATADQQEPSSSSVSPLLSSAEQNSNNNKILNLSTVTKDELQTLIVAWGHPKYRAEQVWSWIRKHGLTDVTQMNNIPKTLKAHLLTFSKPLSLEIVHEARSKDGTVKRAYRCGADGQIIESVLMPYHDGRYTACISSQAGCAQGCVFCATGQVRLWCVLLLRPPLNSNIILCRVTVQCFFLLLSHVPD
jgi:hypothetical protein